MQIGEAQWVPLAVGAACLAALGATLVVARRPGAKGDPTYVALALSSLGVLLAAGAEAWRRPPPGVTAETWTGWALLGLGAGLTLWAHRALGPNYSPTAEHPDPDAHTLVRHGPYRWLRHPQYVGNLLSLAGLLAALGARWAWLALLPFVAAARWRIAREERWLAARYPERARAVGADRD